MKVAIVHEWLIRYAGSERVLEQLLACFPQADLFATVDFLPAEERGFLGHRPVHTTFVQRLPGARRHYPHYLPIMPLAVEQHDVTGYDLVISSSHAVAKGVLTGPDQLHICYCHTPMRYAWDLQHTYLRAGGRRTGWPARWLLHRLRLWDSRTANGVDAFIANSRYVARRIQKVYRRGATVIHPPVAVDRFRVWKDKEDFYVTVARLVPYKRVDLVVRAFAAMPDRQLVVIGDGPEMSRLRRMAPCNVQLLGAVPFEDLKAHLERARAFVFAGEEDFGIAPVEAQACGTPVIAFGRGGLVESVQGLRAAHPTGVLFDEQTSEAVQDAVRLFERLSDRIDPRACRANAQRFAVTGFRREFTAFVETTLDRHRRECDVDKPALGSRRRHAISSGTYANP